MYAGNNSDSNMKYCHQRYNNQTIRVTTDQIKIRRRGRFSKNSLTQPVCLVNTIGHFRSLIANMHAHKVCIKLTYICLFA